MAGKLGLFTLAGFCIVLFQVILEYKCIALKMTHPQRKCCFCLKNKELEKYLYIKKSSTLQERLALNSKYTAYFIKRYVCKKRFRFIFSSFVCISTFRFLTFDLPTAFNSFLIATTLGVMKLFNLNLKIFSRLL